MTIPKRSLTTFKRGEGEVGKFRLPFAYIDHSVPDTHAKSIFTNTKPITHDRLPRQSMNEILYESYKIANT